MAFCGVYTTATRLSHLALLASSAVSAHQRDIASEDHSDDSQIQFLLDTKVVHNNNNSCNNKTIMFLTGCRYIPHHLTGMWYCRLHTFSESDDHVECTLSTHEL